MSDIFALGDHFELFIQAQLASGRYNDASDVIRDALRLLEERERRLSLLDGAIKRGVDDVASGRVTDAEIVFDRLEAKYARLVDQRRQA